MKLTKRIEKIKDDIDTILNDSMNLQKKSFNLGGNIIIELEKIKRIRIPILEKDINKFKFWKREDFETEVSNIELDVTLFNNEIKRRYSIFHDVMYTVENLIEIEERLINKTLPYARLLVDKINQNNPISVWDGFDYNNMDKNIEMLVNTSKIALKNSIKYIEIGDYDNAESLKNYIYSSMRQAKYIINKIFIIDKLISDSKKIYDDNHINTLSLYKSVKLQQNLTSDDENKISKIDAEVSLLDAETKKQLPNWILCSNLLVSINDSLLYVMRSISLTKNNMEIK